MHDEQAGCAIFVQRLARDKVYFPPAG